MVNVTDIQPLYTAADISAAVLAMAQRIDKDWQQYKALQPKAHLTLVVVMNGAIHVGSALSLALQSTHQLAFVRACSYQGTIQQQPPQLDWWHSPKPGQHLLVVEDIVDTGHTLAALQSQLLNDASYTYWKTASLLNKPEARQRSVQLDYVGLTAQRDQFVVGFGLDVDNHYRDLPFIGLYPTS
jgi:hypoxanthine phosphoribosyltransferase